MNELSSEIFTTKLIEKISNIVNLRSVKGSRDVESFTSDVNLIFNKEAIKIVEEINNKRSKKIKKMSIFSSENWNEIAIRSIKQSNK